LSHVKKLAGQTAVYGLSSIIGRLLNYLLTPLLVRVFSPGEYGINTEFYAYVSFFIILFTYGMETAYFRFVTSGKDPQKVFNTSLISIISTSVIISGSLIFFSDSIADKIQYHDHPEYISWFALILGMDAISSIPFSELRVKNKPFLFAGIKLINIACNIFLTLFFVVGCPYILANDQWAFLQSFVQSIYNPSIGIGYIFIANLLSSAISLLLLLPIMLKLEFSFDFSLWKEMLKYSLPMLIVGFAGMINETMDRILLKFYLPLSPEKAMVQLGIYGACYKLSLIMTLFVQAYRMAAEPYFFSQAQNKDSKEVYAVTMKYFVITCSFIFLFVMVYLDIFKYFVGKEGSVFHQGLQIVPLLLLANLCLGIYYNLSIWYKISNKTVFGAIIGLGGAAITLLLNITLIPVYGFIGSAWATLICYASMMFASFIWGKKYYPVSYPILRLSIYIGLALFLYLLSHILSSYLNSGPWLFTANTFLLLTFASITYILEKPKKLVP
jgi:O-antigen/teichoic acid export membrane protein